jgi:hypothetical protein
VDIVQGVGEVPREVGASAQGPAHPGHANVEACGAAICAPAGDRGQDVHNERGLVRVTTSENS